MYYYSDGSSYEFSISQSEARVNKYMGEIYSKKTILIFQNKRKHFLIIFTEEIRYR